MLREDGLSYGDYLEQLTYLIFLKMMDERSRPPYTLLPDYQPPPIPEGCRWPDLLSHEGAEIEAHYRRTLETLGQPARHPGRNLSQRPSTESRNPALLTRLVKELIDSENWLSTGAPTSRATPTSRCWNATPRT